MLSENIQEVLTLQNDLHAKIFLLVVIFGYMCFAFWKYNKLEFDSLSNKFYKVALFVYSRITLFFYPLMGVSFLHINTTLEEMIIFVSGLYGIVFVVTFGFLLMLGFEKTMEFLNIEFERGKSNK